MQQKSQKPVNPEDDVPVSVLNETEKAKFIRNIFTLKKEMLTRQHAHSTGYVYDDASR
jgi:hypothetical protein